ncbi:VanZ family protein [Pleurocapsales cyanobacterium LEGE 06147]|nr:VanZ family protein [Pleurocapsales cyanobacterium LEGE 06147]
MGVGILISSLVLVFFLTLFPFDFSFPDNFSLEYIYQSFYHESYLEDFLVNIIFFIPFGFSLTYLLPRQKLRAIGTLIVVLLASFVLSFTVEVLQAFIPSRSSTLTDILSNSFGGIVGYFGFYLLRAIALRQFHNFLSLKAFTAYFLGYTILALTISLPVPHLSNLASWDSNFPLILGNEATGDRPWQGYLAEVHIADRAISRAEVAKVFSRQIASVELGNSLVASYQLKDGTQERFSDRTGYLPDLFWQGKATNFARANPVFLSGDRWLTTELPAAPAIAQIRQTSQFTIITTVATADIHQSGPARIISLSGGPYQRNFTLAQEKSDLVLRVRSPITGENGAIPELVVPDVFKDFQWHQLIITYANSLLQIYVDKLTNLHYVELTPAILIANYLFPLTTYNLDIFSRVLYYGIIFVPLGLLLGIINFIIQGKFFVNLLLIGSGILWPALLLEVILSSGTDRSISLENLLLSLAIVFISFVLISVTMFLVVEAVKLCRKNDKMFKKLTTKH